MPQNDKSHTFCTIDEENIKLESPYTFSLEVKKVKELANIPFAKPIAHFPKDLF